MANGDDNDLLLQVIQRSMSGVPADISDPYTHTPGVTDKDLDRLTKKLKKQYDIMGTVPPDQAGEQPRILQMGNVAGMLYPQGGGLPSAQPSAQPAQPIVPPTAQMSGTAVPQQPPPPPQPDQPAPQDPTKAVVPPLIPQQPPPATPTPPDQPLMTESERLGHVPQGREADGSPKPPDNRAGIDRGQVMGTGGGPNVIQRTADQAGMIPAQGGGNFFSKLMQGLGEHSNMLLGMGAGLLGAPTLAQGLSRGFAYAGPGMQADIKMQQQNLGQQATYNAFRQAGVPENLSQAAMYDPDLRKQLMEQYVVSRKMESRDVTLPDGTKMTVQYDPYKGQYYDLQGQPLNLGNVPGAIDQRLTGQDAADAAKQANPALYRQAMAFVEGRVPWPNARTMTQPGVAAATKLAMQIDPNLNEQNAHLRNETIMDYGPKGKMGQARFALSTMMGHAEQLDQLNNIIGNYDRGGEYANQARDAIKQLLGSDKGYLDAKAQAAIIRHMLAGESNTAFAGSHAVSGTKEFLDELGKDKGTTSQHGAIKGLMDAASTRLGELQNQFDSSMNTRTEGFHMLSPNAQRIFQKWKGDESGMDFSKAAPSNLPEVGEDPTAFAPVTGARTAAAPAARPPAPAGLPRVKSAAEAKKLPHGAHFIDPNGVERINP